jgi:hypothetical protein
MHRLYTETFESDLEKYARLRREERRERLSLSDGRRPGVGQWAQKATEWIVNQLAILGQNTPCIDNEPACELPLA